MQSILALLQFYNTYDHDDIYFNVAENIIPNRYMIGA